MTSRGKRKHSEKILDHFHFAHYRQLTGCSAIEPRLRLSYATKGTHKTGPAHDHHARGREGVTHSRIGVRWSDRAPEPV